MKTWVRISFVVALAFVFLAGTLAALGTGRGRQTALAWGNTLYVDAAGSCGGHTPCYTTVQAAVDAAATGDEIRVAAGLYTGVSAREGVTQVVYISKTVTIQGGYTTAYTDPPDPAANPTVLSAAGQGRVVYIVGSITPTLAGLRLTGGNATGLGGYYDPDTGRLYDGGGAVYAAYATPTITNCQIDNSGAQAGGGIALFQSPLRLYNSGVLTNQAGYGGGLAIGRAAAIVSGNLFADNQAGYAGGIGVGQSAAQITNNTIRANTAISSGGGIALIGNPAATVRGNLITANSARWGGGIVISSSTALVENNTITANHADEVGGGVNLDHCDATIASNLVQQNDAGHGGGFYLVADTAVVTGNQVLSNTSPRKGGGLYLNESAAQIINNIIAGNIVSGTVWDESGGGGVFVQRGNGVLRGNAILANAALLYGGGVRLYQSAATLESNTIATNTVDTQNSVFAGGGGIYADGAPLLISNTVRANVAYGTGNAYGGGIYLNNSDATLRANAIVSNTARTSGMGSSASGGGVYGDGGAPTLTANEILSNTTVASGGNPVGGGVCLNNATAQIVSNVVAFNQSPVGGGLYLGRTAGTVTGNRIYENSGSVYAGGMYVGYGTNLIQRNMVLSNTAPVGGGLVFYDGKDNLVVNNVFAANHAAGTSWVCNNGGAALAVNYPGPPMLHNTIVSNTGSPGVCFRGRSAQAILPMTNTIIAGHSTGVYVQDGNAVLESTLWYNNSTNWSGSVTDTHPITGNPAFAADGYHLQAGSAAIDQGVATGIAEDIDGQPRPMDAGYDLGADEYPGVGLAVVKSAPSTFVLYNRPLTYTIAITGAGTLTATGVVVTDTLDGWQQVSAVAASQGTCNVTPGWGGGAVCTLGTLASGATARITLTAQISPAVTLGQAMTNAVYVRANETANSTQTTVYATDCRARINNGTTEYTLLQDAVDAAATGDLIRVAGGTCIGVNTRGGYRQVVYLNKQVTIRGGYNDDWTTTDPEGNPTFIDAQGGGRALYVTGGVSPRLENLRFTGGNAGSLGGAYWVNGAGGGACVSEASPTFSNTHFLNNTAMYGAGLFMELSNATVNASRFYSNTASSRGGGLYAYGGAATVNASRFYSNTALSYGGGLYAYGGAATFNNNHIYANTAISGGGGICVVATGAPVFNANLITGNTSNEGGGGWLGGTASRFTNTVIADNRAAVKAGGLYISGSSPQLWHTTLARNVYTESTGIYVTNSSNVTMTNTILVSQSVGIEVGAGNAAVLNGVLWFGNTSNTSGTVTVQNATTGDPAFAADGYHLQAGSAAIDQGVDSGVAVDIDGDARPQNGLYDLGADEYVVAVPVSHTLTIATAGDGHGVVTPTVGAHEYLSGTAVVVTATAQADSDFGGWSGACSGLSPTCTVTMNADKWLTATFTLQAVNRAPTANAGADQSVKTGDLVTLDGSASTDPDGDALAYLWRQTGGVAVSFTPTFSRTTFIAPTQSGVLTFTLTVTDTGGLSDSDTVVITVVPHRIYLPLVVRNTP